MYSQRLKNKKNYSGWIEIICGSMFSGKTEELIRRAKRVKLAKQKIKIFKPKEDVRFKKKKIVSHNENYLKSEVIERSSEILKFSKNAQVVAIDEAQFFGKEIIEVCNKLANDGKRVIVAGLDMDYKGRPFGPMPNLMAIAEYVTKLHAICTKTGKMANYTSRKVDDKNLIIVGDKDKYEALSREAFYNKKVNK
tara:strand:- start:323 stop:904 length:582 start_codon:yes stop_codon:yes gene_type:complete